MASALREARERADDETPEPVSSHMRPRTSRLNRSRRPSRLSVCLAGMSAFVLLAHAIAPKPSEQAHRSFPLALGFPLAPARTLQPDPQPPGAQPAIAAGRGLSPWHVLLSELRSQRPRPFDQLASPRTLRRGFCRTFDEPRPAPWRGPPNTGLPEAGRVANRSQGPPASC